jgi:chondroitin 4-sulfotransferase 11
VNDCLFIHVPKTAGTSIMVTLADHGMKKLKWIDRKHRKHFRKFKNKGSVCFGHLNVSHLLSKNVISQSYWDNAFKFAFVRNPWDRYVSLYFYLRRFYLIPGWRFEEVLERISVGIPIRGLYSKSMCSKRDIGLLCPQTCWVRDDLDFVGRFENLTADWEYICSKLDIECGVLPKKRRWKFKQPFRKYYNNRSRALVATIYKKDLDRFGYKW